MVFPFFVIEAKSQDGSEAEGENQACRAGATMVNVHRQLIQKAAEGTTTLQQGPDWDTLVFSGVMSPTSMDIYANWAEVLADGKVLYHMSLLGSNDLRFPNSITAPPS